MTLFRAAVIVLVCAGACLLLTILAAFASPTSVPALLVTSAVSGVLGAALIALAVKLVD